MNANKIMRIVKALTAVAALAGVLITPEQTEQITAGFLAIYAIASGFQATKGD